MFIVRLELQEVCRKNWLWYFLRRLFVSSKCPRSISISSSSILKCRILHSSSELQEEKTRSIISPAVSFPCKTMTYSKHWKLRQHLRHLYTTSIRHSALRHKTPIQVLIWYIIIQQHRSDLACTGSFRQQSWIFYNLMSYCEKEIQGWQSPKKMMK